MKTLYHYKTKSLWASDFEIFGVSKTGVKEIWQCNPRFIIFFFFIYVIAWFLLSGTLINENLAHVTKSKLSCFEKYVLIIYKMCFCEYILVSLKLLFDWKFRQVKTTYLAPPVCVKK